MARTVARVPPSLLEHGRVLRPVDAEHVYSNPRAEFARLARGGALHRLAQGFFAAVPDHLVGRSWVPPLEAVALGIAAASGRAGRAALMGISAARVHAVVPRALNVAVVGVDYHRGAPRLTDRDATVVFVRRNVARLDVQRYQHELGEGWVTTVEQTLLDLVARPELGGVADAVGEAIAALMPRVDTGLLRELAVAQRRRRAVDAALAQYRSAV